MAWNYPDSLPQSDRLLGSTLSRRHDYTSRARPIQFCQAETAIIKGQIPPEKPDRTLLRAASTITNFKPPNLTGIHTAAHR